MLLTLPGMPAMPSLPGNSAHLPPKPFPDPLLAKLSTLPCDNGNGDVILHLSSVLLLSQCCPHDNEMSSALEVSSPGAGKGLSHLGTSGAHFASEELNGPSFSFQCC